MLDFLLTAGAIVPAIVVAAYILWRLGVRDPFLLTCGALLLGGLGGWVLNVAIEKLVTRKSDAGPPRR